METITLKHPAGDVVLERIADTANYDLLKIDGVLISVDVLRMIFVAPDPSLFFACERQGDAVHARMRIS